MPGLPLVQCLEILGTQQDNRVFQKILFEVRQDIESGATLADSLRKHPKAFDDLYCNMVAAGETGGILDTILQRLSQYIEKIVKLRAAVRSAMVYPVAVITDRDRRRLDHPLEGHPDASRRCSRVSARSCRSRPASRSPCRSSSGRGGGRSSRSIGLARLRAHPLPQDLQGTPHHRRRCCSKLPVLGNVLKKIAVARFCRTLGTLVSSGVPILEALEITAKTAGNAVVEDAIMETRKSIEQGKTIAEPLKATNVFPSMVVQMVAVGEQTGALETMLNKIADFYEDEVDEATANLLGAARADHDLLLGRRHRRHRHLDVHADVRPHQQDRLIRSTRGWKPGGASTLATMNRTELDRQLRWLMILARGHRDHAADLGLRDRADA